MLKAIKNLFGIKEKDVWVYDQDKLDEVPVGAAIIENGGRTEGPGATEYVKISDGRWTHDGIQIRHNGFFNMPFMVVREATVVSGKVSF